MRVREKLFKEAVTRVSIKGYTSAMLGKAGLGPILKKLYCVTVVPHEILLDSKFHVLLWGEYQVCYYCGGVAHTDSGCCDDWRKHWKSIERWKFMATLIFINPTRFWKEVEKELKESEKTAVMTPKEVADYLQLHLVTVYRLLKKQEIPAVKVGGQWRFLRNQIDDWLGGNKQPA